MPDQQLLDLYTDFLIASHSLATATRMADGKRANVVNHRRLKAERSEAFRRPCEFTLWYARHGRELMGLKSPVSVPVLGSQSSMNY